MIGARAGKIKPLGIFFDRGMGEIEGDLTLVRSRGTMTNPRFLGISR